MEFIYNLEVFGITPIKGICTLLTSSEFLTVILGALLIGGVLKKFFGVKILFVFRLGFLLLLEGIKFALKLSKKAIINAYMIILLEIDSKKNGYLVAEYWKSRTITVKGIFSKDITGTESLIIKHPLFITKLISFTIKAKRIYSNVKISLCKNIASIKEGFLNKLSLLK